ncbi:MAG: hypothetical protein OCC46_02500 [Pseudodesulfovibrio sp.]
MSSNEAKLYQKIMSDKATQAELIRAVSEAERVETIVRLGETHGLPVTPEAVHEYLMRGQNEELSDTDLEMVVGGKGRASAEEPEGLNMVGDDDDDILSGGDGNDTMDGGFGNDFMRGKGGNDVMDGGSGRDLMWGNEGNDTMNGGAGGDSMSGGTGDDSMDGGASNDTMEGGSGNDSMDGGTGNDELIGGSGNDTMDGGSGTDWLDGGVGNDVLTGGAGRDVFVFTEADGSDTITDFNPAEDVLRMEGAEYADFDARIENGNTIIEFGETVITLEGVEMEKDQIWSQMLS